MGRERPLVGDDQGKTDRQTTNWIGDLMQRLMTLFAMLMLVVMTGCVNRGNLRVERAGEALDSFHAQRW